MSKYIARFITFREYECSHCHRLPPLFYHTDGGRKKDVPAIYQPLFEAFEDIRTRWGRGIKINSGYRCPKYQLKLYDEGISSVWLSAHIFGTALDLDTSTKEETESLVKLIKKYQPDLRIGWKTYLYKGITFIHIDTHYLLNIPYSKKLYRSAEW